MHECCDNCMLLLSHVLFREKGVHVFFFPCEAYTDTNVAIHDRSSSFMLQLHFCCASAEASTSDGFWKCLA